MQIIADFHIHSKYARATSPNNDIKGLSEGTKIKGIDLIVTGDFTHPAYFNEIKNIFMEQDGENSESMGVYEYNKTKFILGTEVAAIYQDKNTITKKMHHLILTPSLEIAEQVNERLARYGNLKEDGRPILKISSAALAEEIFSITDKNVIIPAHVWTPWFGLFGSKSGVNIIDEAFEDKAHKIFALETGLSSDPQMNWAISSLDRFSLVSNSDAHSLDKLGREANVFDLKIVDYESIVNALKTRKGFVKTYEFYPEEGKYHFDGHRNCGQILSPYESKLVKNICPKCHKKLTIGVLNRVLELADRKIGFCPKNSVPFKRIVPLRTIISKALKRTEVSKIVAEEYEKIIRYFGNEFAVFEANFEQIKLATNPAIALAIKKVNEGNISWIPGYDGEFGELILDEEINGKKKISDNKQKKMMDFSI